MKNIFLLVFLAFFIGCEKEPKTKFDEGIYCLKSYLDKDNFESRYIETFLIKVSKDKIIYFGTVNTWGSVFKRNLKEEKKFIVNDSIITKSTFIGGSKGLTINEFIKLKNAEKIIDKKGINREEFVKYLNKNLIAGKYKLGNKKVTFTEDGKIDNLDSLKTFSMSPRFGTCWWYDYRTIEINNQMWKFEFTKKHLILNKYLPRDVVNEKHAELSNIKIVLER
ncbi:MAG: hypothetical protein KA523_03440 [Flavobacterium sp.]|nr:hypothetical protein [Flavobacterium sp.]